jgi:ketosteroid isomerase-like protein
MGPVAGRRPPRATALARERRLWEAYRAGARGAIEDLIDASALDVGPGGALDREAVVAALGHMRIDGYTIEEFGVRSYGAVEIATYRSTVEGTYRGAPFAAREVYATTVWARSGGAWRVVHRHESPAGGPR